MRGADVVVSLRALVTPNTVRPMHLLHARAGRALPVGLLEFLDGSGQAFIHNSDGAAPLAFDSKSDILPNLVDVRFPIFFLFSARCGRVERTK